MNLTGRATGPTRQALITRAANEATIYYGTPCIAVTLTNEHAETTYIEDSRFGEPSTFSVGPTNYTADYTARIAHPDTTDTCPKCGKENR